MKPGNVGRGGGRLWAQLGAKWWVAVPAEYGVAPWGFPGRGPPPWVERKGIAGPVGAILDDLDKVAARSLKKDCLGLP